MLSICGYRSLLFVRLCIVFCFGALITNATASYQAPFGSLKLCPPGMLLLLLSFMYLSKDFRDYLILSGGPDFVYAWDSACEMKRRKKRNIYCTKTWIFLFRTYTVESFVLILASEELYLPVFDTMEPVKRLYHGYRPATLVEMMKICCYAGCEIRDLLPYCNPFMQ